jgi:hypothetical protein
MTNPSFEATADLDDVTQIDLEVDADDVNSVIGFGATSFGRSFGH